MSFPQAWKHLRRLFIFGDPAVNCRPIAAKAAQLCFDKIGNRLNRSCVRGTSAQLRGYLRAIATPWIDLAIEEVIIQNHRTGGFASQVRSLALDILEQLVVQKLNERPIAHAMEAAA
ncbi:MAG: hypothetical protein IT426_11080 [Pirellulales bacterium]|nr:hypothetical protein [Pirellulales bacterium]